MFQARHGNCVAASDAPAINHPDRPHPLGESSHPAGRSPVSRDTVDAPAQARAPRRAMRSFVPRPFPPPSLAHVPVEYIIDQLHSLAPHYWSKPETADCSIIVPLDGILRQTGQASRSSGSTPDPFAALIPGQQELSGHGRRATEPNVRPAPRMVMKLHMDYLSAHSTLLRGLFSGASPIDLIPLSSPQSTPRGSFFHLPLPPSPQPPPKPSAARGLPCAPLLPRMLPSSSAHPTIYLPVPDPSSLRLLIHYMYFGSTTYIEEALDEGTATWEGMARNVEFLGMGMDIKVCLGRWYGRWRRGRNNDPAQRFGPDYEFDEDDYSDSDDDSYIDSDDDDDDMAPSSAATTASFDCDDRMEIEDSLKEADLEPSRGRQRATRRLGHAISDPGPIRGRHTQPMLQASQSSSPSSRTPAE